MNYPVRKGCSKFDFTVEQIEQKEKRTRVVSVSVFVLVYVWGEEMCVWVYERVCARTLNAMLSYS